MSGQYLRPFQEINRSCLKGRDSLEVLEYPISLFIILSSAIRALAEVKFYIQVTFVMTIFMKLLPRNTAPEAAIVPNWSLIVVVARSERTNFSFWSQ